MKIGKKIEKIIKDQGLGHGHAARPTPKPSLNPNEYHVPATDHRGHSARIGFRVTPEMKRAISIVVAQAPETGWKTDSDFWRWAGRHGLKYIEAQIADNNLSNTLHRIEIIRSVMVEREQLVEFQKSFETMERTVQDLIAGDQPEEARKMLLIIEGEIEVLDNDQWRKTWKRRFNKTFSHIIGGAKIGEVEDDD